MQDLMNSLRDVEFFHDIANEHLDRVAAISKIVEFPARHIIFRENEPAKNVFIIVDGRVSLAICAPRVGCRQLTEVGPGELIGWSPLVGRVRLMDTAHTMTPVKAIAMDGQRILALCAEDPQFGFEFMHRAAQTLVSRLNATRLQLFKMSGLLLPEVQIESD
jgi:CRP/FNR family transcriptional regulator, cyclic AMP receptor protein